MLFRLMRLCLGLTVVFFLFAGGLACATESVDNLQPVTVTDANGGESVQLFPAQQLIVRLPANPSTGYVWTVIDAPNAVLTEDASSAFEQDQSGGNQPPVGAEETEIFTFKANTPGQQTLRLEYKRPWEANVPPMKSVSFNVTVRNNSSMSEQ